MNITFNDYIKDLGLAHLPESEQLDVMREILKTIHTQFLIDIEKLIGKESFNAVAVSAKLGPVLYVTTLKHLVPNYLKVFECARKKVFDAIKEDD